MVHRPFNTIAFWVFCQYLWTWGIAWTYSFQHLPLSLRLRHSNSQPSTTLLWCSFSNSRRESARRWNGNYQHASRQWKDVAKSKRMWLNVTAEGISEDDNDSTVTVQLEKKRMESLQHVLTKAVLWKLFRQDYDRMEIECDVGDPDYLPDVVGYRDKADGVSASNSSSVPDFWGESGRMKPHKALDLMQRYPYAHIVHCRWGMDSIDAFADPMLEFLEREWEEGRVEDPSMWWHGKFTFASLPLDVWRFFNEETGEILVDNEDLEWRELDLDGVRSRIFSSNR
jgi:hypothetical protein